MAPKLESDYIFLLGYNVLYKEYNLTRFNHQKKRYSTRTGVRRMRSRQIKPLKPIRLLNL